MLFARQITMNGGKVLKKRIKTFLNPFEEGMRYG